MQVVRNAITTAQAEPGHFQRQLDNTELEGMARNLIDVTDPESRGNFNNVFFREVVNVVAVIMTDICNKYEAGTQAVSVHIYIASMCLTMCIINYNSPLSSLSNLETYDVCASFQIDL